MDPWEAMSQDLRKHPRGIGLQQNLWDGKLLSYHLSEQYDLSIGVRQCQRIFREMGFRFRKPRPIIAKADEEEKKRYKKTETAGQK